MLGIFLLLKRFYDRILLPSVRTLRTCVRVPLFGARVPGGQQLWAVLGLLRGSSLAGF